MRKHDVGLLCDDPNGCRRRAVIRHHTQMLEILGGCVQSIRVVGNNLISQIQELNKRLDQVAEKGRDDE